MRAKKTQPEEPKDVINGTIESAKISGESSGSMTNDELNIVELSAIRMTDEDQRPILKELEKL